MDNNTVVSDANVEMILSMGFPSESEVRRALKMAKNDLSDAIAILTNEPPSAPYEAMDIDLTKDSGTSYGPHLPPTYDEVCSENSKVINTSCTLTYGTCLPFSFGLSYNILTLCF